MPYFFLSHAHAHAPRRDGDPVTKLAEDVRTRIRELTQEHPEPLGHVARGDRLDEPAMHAVNRELVRCTVLVPLYSARYFKSPDCGRVMSAFLHLHSAQGRTRSRPVAPILWIPTIRPMPPMAPQPIEVRGADWYDNEGLLDIMISDGDAEADRCYEVVLDELTSQILALAEATPARIERSIDISAFPSAFGRPARPPRVRICVLAPDLGRMPMGRERDQYGNTSLHWNPYRTETAEELGSHMETLAGNLGYQPTLTVVDDVELDLCAPAPPTSPVILLLDPWALDLATWRDQLQAFDRRDQPWISVMAAWNLSDAQTARERGRLVKQLNTTLERRFRQRRPAMHLDADIVSSLQGVGRALPAVLREATSRYLRWKHARRDP